MLPALFYRWGNKKKKERIGSGGKLEQSTEQNPGGCTTAQHRARCASWHSHPQAPRPSPTMALQLTPGDWE